MKKILSIKILFLIIFLSFTPNTFSSFNETNNSISKINIKLNGEIYSGEYISQILDRKIYKLKSGNKKEILDFYEKLLIKIDTILRSEKINKNKKVLLKKIYILIEKLKLKYENILYNSVIKVKLGESEGGKVIYGYYKGDPKKGFFGIFANIHGGYEYGTYETANSILSKLKKSNKIGWFVIPTINPDGLEYYKKFGKYYNFYIKGRDNKNNVDLNRNFCTKNFQLKTFIKNGIYLKTGINGCNSEKEIKAIINTLDTYKFNKIISLHSVGGNFFIPDNSFNDKRVVSLANEMKTILPHYDFDISYSNLYQKKAKIFKYEIDEGGSKKYTGTMETYIYEKYNIPTIIIELKKHGKIEYNLLNITKLLK